jgi:hypothetical protein
MKHSISTMHSPVSFTVFKMNISGQTRQMCHAVLINTAINRLTSYSD